MKIIKSVFSVAILWFLSHIAFITWDGLQDNNKPADIAIVFGNKVNEDGSLSERLKARLNQSILLYQQNRVHKIIVSGGLGKEGFFEGDKMKEYLIKHNIPEEIIIVDNQGNDTEKTVKNTICIMRENNYKNAISVSQYFHQTRVKMLFKKYGLENIESSSPYYLESRDLYSLFREFVAYYVALTRN